MADFELTPIVNNKAEVSLLLQTDKDDATHKAKNLFILHLKRQTTRQTDISMKQTLTIKQETISMYTDRDQ